MIMRKVTITVSNDNYKAFKELCDKNGYKISTRIELLLKNDVEKHKKDISFQSSIQKLNKDLFG